MLKTTLLSTLALLGMNMILWLLRLAEEFNWRMETNAIESFRQINIDLPVHWKKDCSIMWIQSRKPVLQVLLEGEEGVWRWGDSKQIEFWKKSEWARVKKRNDITRLLMKARNYKDGGMLHLTHQAFFTKNNYFGAGVKIAR